MTATRGLSISISLVVLLQVCISALENASGRIINGNTTSINIEYHAHLLMDTVGPDVITKVGSGVVISHRLILTTAQNTYGLTNFRAGVGHIEQNLLIWRNGLIAIEAYNFNPTTLENNIGSIIFQFGDFNIVGVRPISLPDELFGNNLPFQNEQGRIIGFGYTTNDDSFAEYLQYGFNRVTNNDICATIYPNHNMEQVFCGIDPVTHSKICGGDLGGAFVTSVNGVDYLTGLTSYVLGTNCIPDQPALFVRVLQYRDFITIMAILFN